MLENIEALADDEVGIESGSPCYSTGRYDIDKPKALICGSPCRYEPWMCLGLLVYHIANKH